MPAPIVPSLYKVTLNATDGSSQLENVRWYIVSAIGGVGADDGDVADAIATALLTPYLPVVASSVVFQNLMAQKCTINGVPLYDASVSTSGMPTPGTGAGDQMPAYVAGVISLRTGQSGKRFRGRLYTFPPGEDDNTAAGVPSAGWVTAASALATALLSTVVATTGINTTTLVPAVFSKANALPVAALTSLVRTQWGTMRLRKLGRGR